jgi:ubiquinone/menaquinone biosynthesis C-methylase UbiE
VSREATSAPRRRDRFAQWAPHYENGEVMSRLLSELQVRAAARLRLASDDVFLDVGCATGPAVRAASATVELALGVDSSAAMIQRARALAAALPRAAFVVADAQQLPFPTATFSAILCSTALRHFTDATRAAAEMVRVLTPAGRIVVADFPGASNEARSTLVAQPAKLESTATLGRTDAGGVCDRARGHRSDPMWNRSLART